MEAFPSLQKDSPHFIRFVIIKVNVLLLSLLVHFNFALYVFVTMITKPRTFHLSINLIVNYWSLDGTVDVLCSIRPLNNLKFALNTFVIMQNIFLFTIHKN